MAPLQRTGRAPEQIVHELGARIAETKRGAAKKRARTNPATRHTAAALRSIEKALLGSVDVAVRTALHDARATLTACLAIEGIGASNDAPARSTPCVSPEALLEYVKHHPGQRGEQIAAALGTYCSSLRPVMKTLIAAGKVKTKGERRAMTYAAV